MENAKMWVQKFLAAPTNEERETVLQAYRDYLATLPNAEQQDVVAFVKANMRPHMEQTVKNLDQLTETAKLVLKGKIVYDGREYIFGEWVTIADYCRLYNYKASRVQNWIDRKIVPTQNVVVIQELNNLKLVKNERYQPA